VTLALAALSWASPAQAAEPSEVPQLHREGRWLVDQHGRVVIVHGLNLVWKHDPYVPPATRQGFTARDARFLHRHGFNGARLGTLWAGVTPEEPGVADPAYFRRWQRVMDLLADRGIWMQLDFHQDQWHEQYGGEGVPDWAATRPAPYDAAPPVVAPFPTGYWTPEVSTVFDDFWADRGGLLTAWADAWRLTARHWRDQPYSMGYDLLNEPWSGREWQTCLATGCEATYRDELQPAFEKALAAIRSVDEDGIVWFEPQQFAGGQRLETFFEAVPGERNLGLSWHNYCPDVFLASQGVPGSDTENCWEFSRDRNRHALDQARRMRATSLMSEFGATDDLRALEIDTAVADEHLMGWVEWAYKHWDDPTTADGDQGLFRDDRDLGTVKRGKLRRLVRTYPQATAGIPRTLRFDARTGDFRYTWTPRAGGPGPAARTTEIFVSPLHYDGAPRVRVRNGLVVGDRDARRLRVRATGSRPVTVRIGDRGPLSTTDSD
jgi:endoglycosylceramidase